MACMVQFVLAFFYYFALATADGDCKSGLAFVPHLPSPPTPATANAQALSAIPLDKNENTANANNTVHSRDKPVWTRYLNSER